MTAPASGDVVCTVATLAAGDSIAFLIAAKVARGGPGRRYSEQPWWPPPPPTIPACNNSDSVTTTVKGFGNIADIAIAKTTAAPT